MFNWLEEEMKLIKTPKFNLVDGPLSDEYRQLVLNSELNVPPSYKQFVIRFGNAKLLRKGSGYLIQVYAVPRDAESHSEEKLLIFGRMDLGLAYFKESLLKKDTESPVFEWTGPQSGLRKKADGFEEWLKKKYIAGKKTYKKKEWNEIIAGPAPFTTLENEIVEARGQYHWKVVGIAENGDLQFEVTNHSKMRLPFLGVEIRDIKGRTIGRVWLPISSIAPGKTKTIEANCYKDILNPQHVKACAMPEPGPEDREYYWEFQLLEN